MILKTISIQPILLKYITRVFLFFTLLLITSTLHCQERNIFQLLSYEELINLQFEASQKIDLGELRNISRAHYLKARKEDDVFQKANSHYYRILSEDFDKAIELVDSVITFTSNYRGFYYPAEAYILKAYRQYEERLYSSALNNYIIANDFANQNNNEGQMYSTLTSIAAIKNIHGFEAEALDIYRKTFISIKGRDLSIPDNYDKYMLLLYNISLAHLRLSSIDSARSYAKRGYTRAALKKDSSL